MDHSSQEIYELCKIPSEEWQKTMVRYRSASKEWQLIPSYVCVIALLISVAGIYYLPASWNSVAIVLSLYCAAQIGGRSGNIDGFQIGYEWGKEEAISRAFKLKPGEIEKIVRTGSEIESGSRSNA